MLFLRILSIIVLIANQTYAFDTLQVCKNTFFSKVKTFKIIELADTSFAVTKGALSLMIVQLPSSYEFKPGTGTIQGLGNDFLNTPSISVTSNKLYITYRIGSTSHRDTFQISNLEMRAIGTPSAFDSMKILFATDTIYQDSTVAYLSLVEPPATTLLHYGSKCAGNTDTLKITSNTTSLRYTFRNISANSIIANDILDSMVSTNQLVNGQRYVGIARDTVSNCWNTDTIIALIHPKPNAELSASATNVCQGDSVTLIATP
ncbi:MAG: hypothetical protein NZM38_05115, partial [Cytophagales bacterium]|nr:hypothetical protein [Cytophagales bacterium]MDW8384133.1 hypothetical protein [Flammeovirgaceae bacterium]